MGFSGEYLANFRIFFYVGFERRRRWPSIGLIRSALCCERVAGRESAGCAAQLHSFFLFPSMGMVSNDCRWFDCARLDANSKKTAFPLFLFSSEVDGEHTSFLTG
jgi:hypothetical protein